MSTSTAVLEAEVQTIVDATPVEPIAPAWLGDFEFIISPSPRNIRSLEILEVLEKHGLRTVANLEYETPRGWPVPRVRYGGLWQNGDKIYPLLDLIETLSNQSTAQSNPE